MVYENAKSDFFHAKVGRAVVVPCARKNTPMPFSVGGGWLFSAYPRTQSFLCAGFGGLPLRKSV